MESDSIHGKGSFYRRNMQGMQSGVLSGAVFVMQIKTGNFKGYGNKVKER